MVEGQHGHDLGGPVSAYPSTAKQGTETTNRKPAHLLGRCLVLRGCDHCHGRASASGSGGPACAPAQGSSLANPPPRKESPSVHLWIACVRSSALREVPSRLSGIYVLVRAHMSQESSQALLARLHVEDPLQFLLRRSQNLLVRPETRVRPYGCQASHSQLVGAHN